MVLLAPCFVYAVMAPAADIQPRTYKSESGEYAWEIDPSDPGAKGPAAYRVLKNGKEVWQGTHDLTLYDAVVDRRGILAGYAYSQGRDGGGREKNDGDFIVAMVMPTGKLRRLEKKPRGYRAEGLVAFPSRPNPQAEGLFIDEMADRFVVRVLQDSDKWDEINVESWWSYRLPDGSLIGKDTLRSGYRKVLAVRPVKGTPLTLVHFRLPGAGDATAHFVLLDPSLKEQGSLEWKDNYSRGNTPQGELTSDIFYRRFSAILDSSEEGRFELLSVSSLERVSVSVRKASSGETWQICEMKRVPYEIADKKSAVLQPVKPGSLQPLGVIALQTGCREETIPVAGSLDFDFDDRGRLGLLRRGPRGDLVFVRINPEGRIDHEMTVANAPREKEPVEGKIAWLSGETWLVASVGGANLERHGMIEWLDVAKGTKTPVPGLRLSRVECLRRTNDGGFLILSTRYEKTSITSDVVREELACYGPDRALRFTINRDSQADLLDPVAFIQTRTGGILRSGERTQASSLLRCAGRVASDSESQNRMGPRAALPDRLGGGGGWLAYCSGF